MAIGNPDSLEKLEFFMELTQRDNIEISPGFFRDFQGCTLGKCGGCCKVVTLDYLPNSKRWVDFQAKYPERVKDFKERKVGNATFISNVQENNTGHFCMYLDKSNGLCTVHEANPLGCSLPMVKFLDKVSQDKALLISTTYGRQWMFKRVDGEKGGICEMVDYNPERTVSDIEKLVELKEIAEAIGNHSTDTLDLIINKLIDIVTSGEIPKQKIVIR